MMSSGGSFTCEGLECVKRDPSLESDRGSAPGTAPPRSRCLPTAPLRDCSGPPRRGLSVPALFPGRAAAPAPKSRSLGGAEVGKDGGGRRGTAGGRGETPRSSLRGSRQRGGQPRGASARAGERRGYGGAGRGATADGQGRGRGAAPTDRTGSPVPSPRLLSPRPPLPSRRWCRAPTRPGRGCASRGAPPRCCCARRSSAAEAGSAARLREAAQGRGRRGAALRAVGTERRAPRVCSWSAGIRTSTWRRCGSSSTNPTASSSGCSAARRSEPRGRGTRSEWGWGRGAGRLVGKQRCPKGPRAPRTGRMCGSNRSSGLIVEWLRGEKT